MIIRNRLFRPNFELRYNTKAFTIDPREHLFSRYHLTKLVDYFDITDYVTDLPF